MLNRCSRGLLRDYEPSCVPSFLALVGSCRRSHIAGSHSGVQVQASKRRSQGGDSKYGFPNKGGGAGEEAGYSDKRATVHKQRKEASSVPVLPPKIDRQKKPSKKSAAERLFGRSSGNNNNNSSGNNNGAAETEEVERQHGDTAPAEPAEPEHAADTRAGTGARRTRWRATAAATTTATTSTRRPRPRRSTSPAMRPTRAPCRSPRSRAATRPPDPAPASSGAGRRGTSTGEAAEDLIPSYLTTCDN